MNQRSERCRVPAMGLLLAALAACTEEAAIAGSPGERGNDASEAGASTEPEGAAQRDADAVAGPSPPGGNCTTLRREALGQVDATSTGEVLVLDENEGERVLYVDASAGGFQGAATQPYVYVDLGAGVRVDVTDFDADRDDRWDLAFKRFTIRTNSADSGPGHGGALARELPFEAIEASDLQDTGFLVDDFIDDETCETALGDPGIGGIWTPFAGWYVYDDTTMVLSPAPVVYAVRGADGESQFVLEIRDYYGTRDGGRGSVSGRYLVRYAAL